MNKLELMWVGKYDKENQVRPEPRILIENPEYSYSAAPKAEEQMSFDTLKQDSPKCYNDNMLIHGDNLLALKSLEQDYAGKIKCIYIDPPYNTGSAFEHYDDNLEHSTWLSLMKPRLELLRNLLAEDGSIWISIDDDEQRYLGVLCDEIFGRSNFVANIIWEKKFSPQNDAKWFSDSHDFIMVYAKNKNIWRPNLLPRTGEMDSRYKNPDNDPRGPWTSGDLSVKTYTASCDYPITTPSGRIVNPPAGYCWRVSKEKLQEMIADNRIWFGSDGDNVPRIKRFLSDVNEILIRKRMKFFNTFWIFLANKIENRTGVMVSCPVSCQIDGLLFPEIVREVIKNELRPCEPVMSTGDDGSRTIIVIINANRIHKPRE